MKKLFLIGKSLKHSISPFIHNRILSELGIDAVYSNVELSDFVKLKEFVEMVRKDKDVIGFNITIPYKDDILGFCDEVSEDVRIIKAANTVKKEDGKLLAYNTDWIGFKKSLEDIGVDVKDKKILVLGSGGAAKACIYGLYRMGAKEVFVANRTYEKAERLREVFQDILRILPVEWLRRYEFKYDIIINTTSVGMYPDISETPFDFEFYKQNTPIFVYDMIYNPLKTLLLREAEKRKSKIENGLKMLVYQAVESEKIWFETINISSEWVDKLISECKMKVVKIA